MEKRNTKTTSRTRAKARDKESAPQNDFSNILEFLDATIKKTRNAKESFYAFVDNVAHRIASRIALRLMAYVLVAFGVLFVFVGLADMIGVFFHVPGLGHMIIGGVSILSALILFLVIH